MASATASEPSVCLSIDRLLLFARDVERLCGGGDILRGEHRRKFLADRGHNRCQGDHAADGGERPQERHIRHCAADVLQRELGGWYRARSIMVYALCEATKLLFIEAAC